MRQYPYLPVAGLLAFVLVGPACAQDTVPERHAERRLRGADTGTSPATCDAGGLADASLADAGLAFSEGGTAATPACDLNGRWLIALRVLADALGQTQASHNLVSRTEMRQDGEDVTVTRGLQCGLEVVHVSALGADVDAQKRLAVAARSRQRHGPQGNNAGDGERMPARHREAVHRPAARRFPSTLIRTRRCRRASQQASGCTPGWEDWDGDGHRGSR